MRIERVELREISLPLIHYFETSFGRTYERNIVLVRVYGEGHTGFGECTAGEGPYYSYETTATAWHCLRDFLVPLLFESQVGEARDLTEVFRPIRGHNMAKAAIETAVWDLEARIKGLPLHSLLGGSRKKIPCGVSIGIQESVSHLLQKIENEIAAGYQRIKVKIKPGWDLEILGEIRKRFPDIRLMADANSAYSLEDLEHLVKFDAYNLMMVEQPLSYKDLVDHRRLQDRIKTPVCLDESIHDVGDAESAIEMGSCRIINVKLGRVGGYREAQRINDCGIRHKIPLWCGGMLEAGIGRAHNIALSTLEGFILPGDVSASRRYYERDIIIPPVEVDAQGFITVPEGIGIGYAPDLERIEDVTVRRLELRPNSGGGRLQEGL